MQDMLLKCQLPGAPDDCLDILDDKDVKLILEEVIQGTPGYVCVSNLRKFNDACRRANHALTGSASLLHCSCKLPCCPEGEGSRRKYWI